MGSVVSIPAPAVTRGTPGTKKGRPAASPLPTINPGPWDHVCFRFWGPPHVPLKKRHCSHRMHGVQVLWAVPSPAGWCAHPLPAPLPMRLVHQGPSPCAWPARGPDVPAVDHDGARAGRCLQAVFHFGHQAQQRPSRLWGLVVGPGREEDMPHGPALLLVLVGTHSLRPRDRVGAPQPPPLVPGELRLKWPGAEGHGP